ERQFLSAPSHPNVLALQAVYTTCEAAMTFLLTPGALDLAALYRFWRAPETVGAVELDPAAWPQVEASAAVVTAMLDSGRTVYGVNTGFGILARQKIGRADVAELQRRLVLSHCAGVG